MKAGRIRQTDRNKNEPSMIRPNYNTTLELEEEVPYWYLISQQVRLKDVAKIFLSLVKIVIIYQDLDFCTKNNIYI